MIMDRSAMQCPGSSAPSRLSDPDGWLDLHGDVLYRFAHRYVANAALAEDLVQDTFLAALSARASFAGAASEQSWFIGILKNKIKGHFRRQAREVPLDQPSAAAATDPDFVPAGPDRGTWYPARRPTKWMIDPDDPSEREEFWAYLQLCLRGLDAQHARLFVLREMHDTDRDELCQLSGLSESGLRVTLFRARQRLRSCLEQRWLQSRRTPPRT
jgi:RNA polymerase sigma-70 factor, ECF subfamily